MSEHPAPMFVEDGHTLVLIGEADGAIPNGTRIIKTNSNNGDSHLNGAGGTVFSSIALPEDMRVEHPEVEFMYWIVWDDLPAFPTAVSSNRIETLL